MTGKDVDTLYGLRSQKENMKSNVLLYVLSQLNQQHFELINVT